MRFNQCVKNLQLKFYNKNDKKIVHNSIKTVNDTINLQSSIDNFITWCRENDFELNEEKCKVMTISRKRSPLQAEYFMNGKAVKRVFQTSDVGVSYDDKFSFNGHAEIVSKKAISALSFVKRQCYGRFNVDTAKMLYCAIVRSHLEFASCIWAPHHVVHIQSIESVQRQFVLYANRDRYVNENDDSYRLRPYIDRCTELELVSLLRRRTNASVFFIHDILTGRINSQFLRDRITLFDGTRVLRNNSMIRLIPNGPDYVRYSAFNFACNLFNKAVQHVDPSLPSTSFRTMVRQLPDSVFGTFGDCG